MSISYKCYCGPAIVCIPKQVWTEFYKDKVCLKCSNFRNILEQSPTNKFCPDCGQKLFNIQYKELAENSVFNIMEKVEEKLYAARNDSIKNKHIYLSNVNFDDQPREFSVDIGYDDEKELTVLDSGTIENEKLWFVGKFRKEIEYLRNYYGSDNVDVEFVFFTEVF